LARPREEHSCVRTRIVAPCGEASMLFHKMDKLRQRIKSY